MADALQPAFSQQPVHGRIRKACPLRIAPAEHRSELLEQFRSTRHSSPQSQLLARRLMYPHIACVATKPSGHTRARRRSADPVLHVSEPPGSNPFPGVGASPHDARRGLLRVGVACCPRRISAAIAAIVAVLTVAGQRRSLLRVAPAPQTSVHRPARSQHLGAPIDHRIGPRSRSLMGQGVLDCWRGRGGGAGVAG